MAGNSNLSIMIKLKKDHVPKLVVNTEGNSYFGMLGDLIYQQGIMGLLEWREIQIDYKLKD